MARSTIEERFWSKVDVGLCWEWRASRDGSGYGMFHTGAVPGVATHIERAHRWAYETLVGLIPNGMHLDHLCRNRACVNPDHLDPVVPPENTARGFRRRMTHCKRGHELNGPNLYINSGGSRSCRTCMSLHRANYSERKRASA